MHWSCEGNWGIGNRQSAETTLLNRGRRTETIGSSPTNPPHRSRLFCFVSRLSSAPELNRSHPEQAAQRSRSRREGSVIHTQRSDLSRGSFMIGHVPYRIPPSKGTPPAAEILRFCGRSAARRLRMTPGGRRQRYSSPADFIDGALFPARRKY